MPPKTCCVQTVTIITYQQYHETHMEDMLSMIITKVLVMITELHQKKYNYTVALQKKQKTKKTCKSRILLRTPSDSEWNLASKQFQFQSNY